MQRVAVLSLLAGAFALSAPLIMAADHPDENVEVTVKDVSKQVIKWAEDDDGVRTEKTYEIISENGETNAYEIDENGKKTEIDIKEIEKFDQMQSMSWKGGEVMAMNLSGDDNVIVKRFHTDKNSRNFPENLKKKLIIKRLGDSKKSKSFAFSTDEDAELHFDGHAFAFGDGNQAEILLKTAQSLLDQAESDDLSLKTQQKLAKARKALKDARKAVESENK